MTTDLEEVPEPLGPTLLYSAYVVHGVVQLLG